MRGLGDTTTYLHQGQGQAQCAISNDQLKTFHNYTDSNDVPQPLRTNWSTRSRGTSMVYRFICKKLRDDMIRKNPSRHPFISGT